MSTATYGLQDIKKELQHLSGLQVAELCLRLARHKKENKELLAYLLFEADNDTAFIEKVKAEAGFMFSQLPVRSYEAAKYLRKILRLISKYTKFMSSKEAEIDLLLNFCTNYIQYADRRTAYKPLRLILVRQVEKIRTAIGKLHEDLQYDFINDYNTVLDDAEKKLSWFNKSNYLL
ncbi:hypothetical protein FO440_16450 [Mucilaginibacter corticis]|uniref:Uncharacterized protein n=1 Tax=Mucilaginibacter corticis TaxID=2597670 RepID=A0A556MHJ4_9SPHI|nr:hypothetical protein [Mucilaginibacter corticis]TSJ39339.1 hypothetical protein FO440_16450 [Mucilaginibacter corticis]